MSNNYRGLSRLANETIESLARLHEIVCLKKFLLWVKIGLADRLLTRYADTLEQLYFVRIYFLNSSNIPILPLHFW